MEIKTIDLYKYFNIERKEGYKGYLTCYLNDQIESLGSNRKFPAMLVIAGGGYAFVSDREKEPVAMKYLSSGFNCFAIDYSIAPAKYPTSFLEVSMAMIYIRENAETLHVEKDKVCAIGFSAGGHLCCCLATLFNEKVLDVFEDKKKYVRPDSVILAYPVITSGEKAHKGSFDNLVGEDESLREYLSLENRVTKDSSPAFIFTTFKDSCVPCVNSLLIAGAYEKNNVPFSLHIFEKGEHGMSVNDSSVQTRKNLEQGNYSKDYNKWIKLSINWLKEREFIVED